jgi:hypothetical protein
MSTKMEPVGNKYGAPMGRVSAPDLDLSPRSVRLFRVPLDSGGYDNGGAYWGFPDDLWCARDRDGSQQFVRSPARYSAAFALGIPATALVRPLDRWPEYAEAMLDGRCPYPPGKDRVDLIAWMQDSGAAMGQPR